MIIMFNRSALFAACVVTGWMILTAPLAKAQVPASAASVDEVDDALAMTPEEAISQAFELVERLEADPVALAAPSGQEAFQRASRLANYILAKEPLNKTASYILGRLALLTGRPREAMSAIEAYIGTKDRPGPGNSDWYAHALLGDIRLVSYPQLARPEFLIAAELAPDEPKAVIGVARANLKLNRASEAIDAARTAIQLDRNNDPEYRVVLANALLLDEKNDEAATAAREAIALGERKAQTDQGKVKLLTSLKGYYDLYLKCVEKLMAQYPDNSEYMLQYVRTWQDKSDLQRLIEYHSALKALEAAQEYEGFRPSPGLLLEQANLNRIVGRNEVAIELLERILDESPEFKPARELLDVLQPEAPSDPAAE